MSRNLSWRSTARPPGMKGSQIIGFTYGIDYWGLSMLGSLGDKEHSAVLGKEKANSTLMCSTMILSGASIIKREIVRNLLSAHQIQPCGVDISFRRVLNWTSPATVDFDNSRRQAANTFEIPFHLEKGAVALAQGSYLVEFNETVRIPPDYIAQIFVRSSLWRSGVLLTAGVIDAGYKGALGALLDVRNPHGIALYKNAKLGQVTVHTLDKKVEGYSDIYQFSPSTLGRDGQVKDRVGGLGRA
ncbi:hypothetical protein UA08_07446 [Talaromyces atroroseus]|uniref:Uncharacterized protein n=1 Tax=Talaromyces atroroseus TaxID=1441469 RepID=A0A225ADT9_TALAT|nr:hypothetical protein UA08_07446 [Talaromyces atroroseus]OKL57163.1 hypothetical protein UA08_07446 [Talaromyces atroroseus]